MKLFSDKGSLREIIIPAEKKISTPAGQRLSTIMDTGAPPIPPRSILRKHALNDVEESSTSSVLGGKGGQSYSTVWSEGSIFRRDAKLEALRNNKHVAKRGGWWRLAFIILLALVVILALALGLAFGLKKKGSSDKPSSSSTAQDQSTPTRTSGSNASGSSASATAPADFPLGTYSFTTFLDTVTTDCATNNETWNCYPYTIYNDDKTKAATTFNWIITGSKGNYKISSTDNPLSLTFDDTTLNLYSEGQDSERYTFQFTMDKKVVPQSSITDDGSTAVCYFNSTTFTGYLYTKMAKGYPSSSQSISTAYQAWPYAVRAEQSVAGGNNVPNCYKTVNGRITDKITDGISAADSSTLCSCLYRNYLTS